MLSRIEDGSSESTGLTQEIDIMDIGSSTPKRKKSKSPLKGVLKVRSLSDDEAPPIEHTNPSGAHVMFSTPVSSLKASRSAVVKPKSTRFQLPSSEEKNRNKSIDCASRYMNVCDFIFLFIWQSNENNLSVYSKGNGNVANKFSTND